jgi:SAM-dependent methyltransferase
MNCRHCKKHLVHTFVDLGFAPPSNNYLSKHDLNKPEVHFPLRVKVCDECWLVQTEDYTQPDELFSSDYAYFSSTSTSWLAHAKAYAEQMKQRFALNINSLVIEVASNDGYLLQNFLAKGIPCLGIEPTASTAEAAEKIGIPVLRDFFGEELGKLLAKQGNKADLIVANNVYAHVPDINDFTKGLKEILKPGGTITLEFPHLLKLIEQSQFDTIYHEHYSYLSLIAVIRIFETVGLRIWHVEELDTHGGSLRVFGCHQNDDRSDKHSVQKIIDAEITQGLKDLNTYKSFQKHVEKIKDDLISFLIEQKRKSIKIAAYGAAAKGNTLLNYAGIKQDLLPFVFDAAESKQGKFLPGSHIPILSPEKISEFEIDYLFVLPWNIKTEIMQSIANLFKSPVKFLTVIPQICINQ